MKRSQKGTGYTNPCSHIFTDHAEQLDSAENSTDKMKPIIEHFWPKKTCGIHGWLEMVVMMMLPFSFCDNPLARVHMRRDSMSTNTLMKYLTSVTQIIERKIAVLLLDMFALVFNGWTSGSTRYLDMFVSNALLGSPGALYVLLAFSSMDEEESMSADEHMHITTFVLHVYRKSWKNVGALIGDNCAANKALAKKQTAALLVAQAIDPILLCRTYLKVTRMCFDWFMI